MSNRPNPLALGVLGSVSLGDSEASAKAVITRLVQEATTADKNRQSWLEHQIYLTKLRYGIRRPRTFPWKGASNIHIPYIDKAIRKLKPLFMRLLVEPDPVVEFVGDDEAAVDSERKAEEVYNWLFKTEMAALDTLAYTLDCLLHRGLAFVQVGWDYCTEYECRVVNVPDLFPEIGQVDQATGQPIQIDPNKVLQLLAEQYEINLQDAHNVAMLQQAVQRIMAGEVFVKLSYKKVVRDRPAIWDQNPVQIVLPNRTTDPANADWVVVQHVIPLRKLQQMEADGFFRPGSVSKVYRNILDASKKNQGSPRVGNEVSIVDSSSLYRDEQQQDELERIWGEEDVDNVLLWEVFHWHDHNGDGLRERVHSYIHPKSMTDLATRPYAAPFNEWPFVVFQFEKTRRRLYSSRGVTAMLEGIQKEINAQHNCRLDGMTIRNAPTYQTQLLAGFKARNFRVVPGTVLQLPQGASLQPVLHDRGSWPETVNEEQLLRTTGEDYVGSYDAVIGGQSGEARTATEIQVSLQAQQTVASLDTMLFQLSMRELHTKIWQLFLELGPSEVFVKVLGAETALREPVKIKKADIARKFRLIPTGTIANTNRALELAHAREALQIYLQDQSGFINPFELRRWHLFLLDYRWARRMLNSPEQAQELTVLRQAAAELQKNPQLQASLNAGAQPEMEQPDAQRQVEGE